MAEFQEVMQQYKRMCCGKVCSDCDFHKFKTSLGHQMACLRFLKEYPVEAEALIMNWAAEHPEPVYPTWEEWLLKIGAARRVPVGDPWPVQMADGSMLEPAYDIVVRENERIPAYIAEKLGLQPKEG